MAQMSPQEKGRVSMTRLSQHLGIPIRKASPEALEALERYRAREKADAE